MDSQEDGKQQLNEYLESNKNEYSNSNIIYSSNCLSTNSTNKNELENKKSKMKFKEENENKSELKLIHETKSNFDNCNQNDEDNSSDEIYKNTEDNCISTSCDSKNKNPTKRRLNVDEENDNDLDKLKKIQKIIVIKDEIKKFIEKIKEICINNHLIKIIKEIYELIKNNIDQLKNKIHKIYIKVNLNFINTIQKIEEFKEDDKKKIDEIFKKISIDIKKYQETQKGNIKRIKKKLENVFKIINEENDEFEIINDIYLYGSNSQFLFVNGSKNYQDCSDSIPESDLDFKIFIKQKNNNRDLQKFKEYIELIKKKYLFRKGQPDSYLRFFPFDSDLKDEQLSKFQLIKIQGKFGKNRQYYPIDLNFHLIKNKIEMKKEIKRIKAFQKKKINFYKKYPNMLEIMKIFKLIFNKYKLNKTTEFGLNSIGLFSFLYGYFHFRKKNHKEDFLNLLKSENFIDFLILFRHFDCTICKMDLFDEKKIVEKEGNTNLEINILERGKNVVSSKYKPNIKEIKKILDKLYDEIIQCVKNNGDLGSIIESFVKEKK